MTIIGTIPGPLDKWKNGGLWAVSESLEDVLWEPGSCWQLPYLGVGVEDPVAHPHKSLWKVPWPL